MAGVCFAALALAQNGVVKSEGQPIPGAAVRATQGERVLLTLTDENGAFNFTGMTPGAWNVDVEMFGFERLRKEVQIAAIPTKIDLTLQLRDRSRGQQARPTEEASIDTTQMSAANAEPPAMPQVGADAANESLVMSGSVSQGLQSTSADARDLGGFGPGGGFGGPGGPGGPGGGGRGGGGFAGGGGGRGGGGFGGGPGGRAGRGGRGGVPRDRNGNPAFVGNRNPNNNRVTGSIFYTLGNSVLNARPFSVNGLTEPKAAYSQNRYGISAGGPLAIPKLFNFSKVFWFVNYYGNKLKNGVENAYSEPTAAERMGNFSGISQIIYDPTNGAPFGGNMIPSTRISSIATGLLNFLPLPNQNVASTNQNYRLIAANPNDSQNLNTRFNTTLSQKDTLALTFNYQSRTQATFQYFGCCDLLDGHGYNTNLNWRHRFATGIFNNVTLLFNRNTNLTTPYFANGPNVAAELGIQGTSPNPLNFGPPNLSFTNFSALSDTNAAKTAVWSYGVNDTLSVRRGKHNWSFGGGVTHFLNNSITDQNGRGQYSFTGLQTAGYTSAGLPMAGTGFDFADFLLGQPESSSIRYGDSSLYFRSNGLNAFATDDYRIANNFSVILGVRWEYFTPWHEEYGHISNLLIDPNFSGVQVVCADPSQSCYQSGLPSGLIRSDKNNFGPRLGIAWKPLPKTVVRAGYGWYYNPSQYNQFMQKLGAQPPFAITNSITTSSADTLNLATGLVAVPTGKSVTNTYAVALNYLNSYAQTWNLSVQQDLPKRWVGELLYTGIKGTRLDVPEAPNQAPLGSALTGYSRLPIPNIGNFTFDAPVGNSNLNSLQVRLTRRFQRGISTNFFYTFAKSIDDVALAQNFYDQAAERALSSNDHRNVVTANWVLASPVDAQKGFLSHPAFVAKALKDWTLSGSLTAQTGSPLTATVSGNLDGTSSISQLRANATGQAVDSGSGFFNLAAFAVPAAGTFGDAGRNTITGPGTFSINMSLARSINLHSERRRLEFRVDTNNVLNHVNPTGLITIVNSSQYGLITNATQMRQISATVRLRF